MNIVIILSYIKNYTINIWWKCEVSTIIRFWVALEKKIEFFKKLFWVKILIFYFCFQNYWKLLEIHLLFTPISTLLIKLIFLPEDAAIESYSIFYGFRGDDRQTRYHWKIDTFFSSGHNLKFKNEKHDVFFLFVALYFNFYDWDGVWILIFCWVS